MSTTVEDYERAMDLLFTDFDYRRADPDPWLDWENERLSDEQHEPTEKQ